MSRFQKVVNLTDRQATMEALKKLYGTDGVAKDGDTISNREPRTACVSEVDKNSAEFRWAANQDEQRGKTNSDPRISFEDDGYATRSK